MESDKKQSNITIALDTFFLCILSLILGFLTFIFFLNSGGTAEQADLAAPIIAIDLLPIAAIASGAYFFILRFLKNRYPLSRRGRYLWYFFITLIVGIYVFYTSWKK